MEIASAFDVANKCLEIGVWLYRKYKSYKGAEEDIREILLRAEHVWMTTQSNVEFLQLVWNELEERLQLHFHSILSHLQTKLVELSDYLNQVIGDETEITSIREILRKKGLLRKWKFTIEDFKAKFEDSFRGIQEWQDMLGPRYALLTRGTNAVIDKHLANPRFSKVGELQTIRHLRAELQTSNERASSSVIVDAKNWKGISHKVPIKGGLARFGIDIQKNRVIQDTFVAPIQIGQKAIERDVAKMARVLSKVDPARYGLLRCCYVVKYPPADEGYRFRFILDVPPQYQEPVTLRNLLQAGNCPSLSDRVALAKRLASSVLYVHGTNFVHKSIRPENIVVFHSTESRYNVSTAFLVGLENFRATGTKTLHLGDASWDRNIYRHPQRQGLHVEEDFNMQHDVYSLGVCLLEIGLWTSFVVEETGPRRPASILAINDILEEKNFAKRGQCFKEAFEKLASEQLPTLVGDKYTSLVLACLGCLDGGASVLGEEEDFADEDGYVIGIRYIEKILAHFHELNI